MVKDNSLQMPSQHFTGMGLNPPRFFHHMQPPHEFLITELVYFLIVFSLCIIIFSKTKEIYALTKHRGIFYFRNIFLYFAIAYLFRVFMVSIPLLMEETPSMVLQPWRQIFLVLVGYSSTMAILSLAMSLLFHKVKLNSLACNSILHATAILSSLIFFLTRSNELLIMMQTAFFLFSVVYIIFRQNDRKKGLISQNKVTYILLFAFWLMNILATVRSLFPRELRIPVYIISAGIFFSIYLRVRKRLNEHAKKTRPA